MQAYTPPDQGTMLVLVEQELTARLVEHMTSIPRSGMDPDRYLSLFSVEVVERCRGQGVVAMRYVRERWMAAMRASGRDVKRLDPSTGTTHTIQ